MPYDLVTNPQQLTRLCDELSDAPLIAFDTEFVSEDTYRPQLCLIQVAAGDRLAVVDPLQTGDVTPFWKLVSHSGHATVVHAGREELLFCLYAVDAPPQRLFDIQIAAGLVGYEYPASYGSLLSKLVGRRVHKAETRTDWRRRPLSEQQIEYALDDVRYLGAMHEQLAARLAELGRTSWLEHEMATWQSDIDATRANSRWWRVSGISGLPRRSLAIVRELWLWREAEAARRNLPTRRVLRDDLIIELAKRRNADPKQMRAVRGLDRGDLQRAMPQLSQAVARALELPDEECPKPLQRETSAQLNVVGQFLSSALSSICRSAQLAPSIVGTASDVRELIAYRLGLTDNGEVPLLGRGWRAEVIGRLIGDLLEGKLAIRVRDPLADEPLAFEPTAAGSSAVDAPKRPSRRR